MVLVDALRLGLLSSCFVAASYSHTAHAEELTYTRDIKPLLDRHCASCHHEGARSPDLSQFPFASSEPADDQEAIVAKVLVKVAVGSPTMPPGFRQKLNANEVALITRWRDEGLNP